MLRMLAPRRRPGQGGDLVGRGKKTRPWRVLAAVVAATFAYSPGDDGFPLDELLRPEEPLVGLSGCFQEAGRGVGARCASARERQLM